MVDATEDQKRAVVGAIALICGGEENGRIDECPGHSLGVDAPRVVLGGRVGRPPAVVPREVGERAVLLPHHFDADAAVVLDVPAEVVAVVDLQLVSDTRRDVGPIPRHLALGVDAVTAHIELSTLRR